jgi:hypothetical protein
LAQPTATIPSEKVSSLYIFKRLLLLLAAVSILLFLLDFLSVLQLTNKRPVNAITAIDFCVHYDVILGTLSIFFNENKIT